MLYRIGTVHEIPRVESRLPACVRKELLHSTSVLDEAYGADRNYLQSGGYSLIAETEEDREAIRSVIRFESHSCEWADRHGDWVAALYLMNDDFSIVVFMPVAIAPVEIKNELED